MARRIRRAPTGGLHLPRARPAEGVGVAEPLVRALQLRRRRIGGIGVRLRVAGLLAARLLRLGGLGAGRHGLVVQVLAVRVDRRAVSVAASRVSCSARPTNGGARWAPAREIESPGDRGYYSAPAISPDGKQVYVVYDVYDAFTTPFAEFTSEPRTLLGVVKQAPVTPRGSVGTFEQVQRGLPGDARGSSQHDLAAEFLGDSVYAAATRDYGTAVWNDCSRLSPSRPSTQLITIWSVAPAPSGAPLAMSTDGAGERSLRAPATPCSTQRPIDASKKLQVSLAGKMFTGRCQCRPPSSDLIIWICPTADVVGSKPNW